MEIRSIHSDGRRVAFPFVLHENHLLFHQDKRHFCGAQLFRFFPRRSTFCDETAQTLAVTQEKQTESSPGATIEQPSGNNGTSKYSIASSGNKPRLVGLNGLVGPRTDGTRMHHMLVGLQRRQLYHIILSVWRRISILHYQRVW